jgi:hypothetical protein
VGVAGYLAYKKPAVRSFFGAGDAYAASTGAGRFSLKGLLKKSAVSFRTCIPLCLLEDRAVLFPTFLTLT